tara:strand:+ start:5038 stop:6177 length:1140 start_codon:yes stop_codon:yes gene_type:complete
MGKKILINAISARNGGGVTYIKNIIPFFVNNPNDLHITLLIGKDNMEFDEIKNTPSLNLIFFDSPSSSLFKRIAFELFEIPKIMKKGNYDILFSPGGTSFTLRSRNFQTVTMFRNVWPHFYIKNYKKDFLFEPFTFIRILIQKLVIIYNCKYQDKTIFISEFGKKIISKNRLLMNNSIVISHAISPVFFEIGESNLIQGFDEKKYLLYVSSFLPYKNHANLIKSYAKVKSKLGGIKLIMIGKISKSTKSKLDNLINKLNISNEAMILEEVNQIGLASCYQKSLFNIFLSSCENCPNIMLESMASSRPLLSSIKDPMPEFGKDYVTYCDPTNINDISEKLIYMKKNISALEGKALLGKENITDKKGWDRVANKTLEFISS